MRDTSRHFADRYDAGQQLASLLHEFAGDPSVVVLALPRGGVPVAHEVASHLRAPLDVILVRKLGLPGRKEVAMGAIAEGRIEILDEQLIREFRVNGDELARVRAREQATLADRSRLLRGSREPLDLSSKHAIIVDDGIATGSTAAVACHAARQLGAARVTLAVPVMPKSLTSARRAAEHFGPETRLVAVHTPREFWAVGQFYEDFTQVTDEEARALLLER